MFTFPVIARSTNRPKGDSCDEAIRWVSSRGLLRQIFSPFGRKNLPRNDILKRLNQRFHNYPTRYFLERIEYQLPLAVGGSGDALVQDKLFRRRRRSRLLVFLHGSGCFKVNANSGCAPRRAHTTRFQHTTRFKHHAPYFSDFLQTHRKCRIFVLLN